MKNLFAFEHAYILHRSGANREALDKLKMLSNN